MPGGIGVDFNNSLWAPSLTFPVLKDRRCQKYQMFIFFCNTYLHNGFLNFRLETFAKNLFEKDIVFSRISQYLISFQIESKSVA